MGLVLRSIGSVLVGCLVFAAATVTIFRLFDRDPHADADWPFMISATTLGIVAAFLAGWVSALVACRNEARHAMAMATVLAIIAVVSWFTTDGSRWSEVAVLSFMVPAAVTGGLVRQRQRRGRGRGRGRGRPPS